jgi:hypothetical protein
MLKFFDVMWRFIQDREIEPTNNFAKKTDQASSALSDKFFAQVA